MALVPISPPPGVVKPGTLYGAKGKWFDTLWVRWFEGAMQAIGGFERHSVGVEFRDSDQVWAYDEPGTFVDETVDAADEDTAGDVAAFTTAAVEDALYIASESIFLGVTLDIFSADHAAADWALVWEYFDGALWQPLTVLVDNTDELSDTGLNFVTWSDPGDWAATTVNGAGPFFYVRARASAVTTGTPTVTMSRIYVGQLVAVDEVVRGTHSWVDNANEPQLAFGTETKLYHYALGVLSDITPAGFTAGQTDATYGTGKYDDGVYGDGLYGVGNPGIETLTEAQTWQLDNWGEDLVAVAHSDKRILYWDTSAGGGTPAAELTATVGTIPVNNTGVVVTPENFVIVLGADGRARRLRWPEQENINAWLPTADGAESDIRDLPGKGAILAGKRTQQETLIWTTNDVFALRYIGGNFVYQVVPVGSVGAISRRSMAVVGSVAYWMSPRGFQTYNGFTQSLDSPLADSVFSDLNVTQRSKIWAEVREEFGEITWHYPSANSTECDKAVTLNYKGGFWYNNTVERTAGEDAGVFEFPLAFDAQGQLWRHEVGDDYQGDIPQAISGPMEIGDGERWIDIDHLIPDEKTLGQLDIFIRAGHYPSSPTADVPANPEATDGEEIEFGPFTPANPTDVRISARQIRIRIRQNEAGWRFGTLRAELQPGDAR